MKLSLELLNILSLILPGLMAIKIQDIITTSNDKSFHELMILALIYSYVIYLISGLLFSSWEPLVYFTTVSSTITIVVSSNNTQVLTIIGTILFLPLLLSWCKQKDIPMRWLRKLSVTKNSSMPNIWADTFHNEKRHIQIHLKDERIIRGWPHRYSPDPKDGYIYVTNPSWVNTAPSEDNDEDYIETNAHGFLISREKIDFIEFSFRKNENSENISQGDRNE